MIKRIAIIGAQGTGKTTLAKAASDELGLPLICEGAREISALLEVRSPDRANLNLAKFLQQAILIRQIFLEKYMGHFVSDRSTVDCFAYWQKLIGKDIEPEVTELYEKLARENTGHYQLLVFCPIEFPLKDDSFRYTDQHFQREIDDLLRACIKNWGLQDKTLFVTGSLEDRLKQLRFKLPAL